MGSEFAYGLIAGSLLPVAIIWSVRMIKHAVIELIHAFKDYGTALRSLFPKRGTVTNA